MCLVKRSLQKPACKPWAEVSVEQLSLLLSIHFAKIRSPETFQDNTLFVLKCLLRSLLHTLFHLTARRWIWMMHLRLVLLNFMTMAYIIWKFGAASSSCSQVISTDGRKQAAKVCCKKELRVWNIDDINSLNYKAGTLIFQCFFIMIIIFVFVFYLWKFFHPSAFLIDIRASSFLSRLTGFYCWVIHIKFN